MTINTYKEHFYINRKARDRFNLFDQALFNLPQDRQESLKQAEQQTEAINRRLTLLKGPDAKKILPAQFHGMKLLHELFHHVMTKGLQNGASDLTGNAVRLIEEETSNWHTSEYLTKFLNIFPPQELYRSVKKTDEYLRSGRNLRNTVEEAYLVWLNNQNPALDQFSELLADSELQDNRTYAHLIRAMQQVMRTAGPMGTEDVDLAELLTLPIRHAPGSLLAQLRYIRLHWEEILEDCPYWGMLGEAITSIEDEDRYLFFERLAAGRQMNESGWGEKEAHIPAYSTLADAPARYSHDASWMPEVVMIAKSTYVWLDQLSKQYGYHVARLQDIPDRELDLLSERGFTSLWLIGLWQRSHASRQIKQLQGNPEAKASAYALEKYDIADELGGYEGYLDLRNRAMQRGIRLASDMVPNHTGIDSELVRNRPDWFLGTNEPPYPNYSYNGPNLSPDNRYGIYIEDGYWNRSDAAVTFKRTDFMTGETRYIYHGNDGTNMPWNDTAQLNFLSPEVREGVIQQILHVARMFPVIRFDAAMVLAKMHIQRLWFPLPGHTAGVPSRGSAAMSMADFDAAIPEEFWREVVDRIKEEVPDTLLLAEAFWMLEGYFVRTLGMHRVYNSAFMHMLKKEDNASYRQLIKNTVEFDAEILKRYVNFMNNPDEDTAIAQFGKGDKYFGVCMMMITMPGLPMIGHGQIEGLTEKYGMEYARAYYDEYPDNELVGRHYREIFPIMKKRRLFAEVSHFYLFDLYGPDGKVNENMFAYTNRLDNERALVIYNNRYEAAEGWIRISAGYLLDGQIRQTLLADALLLPDDEHAYAIFRDHASGLEYIRSCRGIRENGLYTALNGYRYNLFLDFREVRPSKLKPYDRLCHDLAGRGVASVELEALSMSLRPLHNLLSASLEQLSGEPLMHNGLDTDESSNLFGTWCMELLKELSVQFETIMERPLCVQPESSAQASSRFKAAILYCDTLKQLPGTKRILAAIGINHDHDIKNDIEEVNNESRSYLRNILLLIILETIQEMLEHNGLLHHHLVDDWLLGNMLTALPAESEHSIVGGTDLAELMSCLLALKTRTEGVKRPAFIKESLRQLFASHDPHFERLMQFQHIHGKTWFREHRFTLFASWLSLQAILHNHTTEAVMPLELDARAWTEALEQLDAEVFLAGYEMNTLLNAVEANTTNTSLPDED